MGLARELAHNESILSCTLLARAELGGECGKGVLLKCSLALSASLAPDL